MLCIELDGFNECSMEDVFNIIDSETSKTSGALDPLSTVIAKQFLLELLPCLTTCLMHPCSTVVFLRINTVPSLILTRRLKTQNADLADVKSYRTDRSQI